MRFFACFIIFVCLAFPAFSQNAREDRHRALSDSMDYTLSDSRSKLENFNEDLKDSDTGNSYASYREKYVSLQRRLNETEARIDLLTRTKDKTSLIKEQRDKYENLINELDQVKSDYDSWMSSNK